MSQTLRRFLWAVVLPLALFTILFFLWLPPNASSKDLSPEEMKSVQDYFNYSVGLYGGVVIFCVMIFGLNELNELIKRDKRLHWLKISFKKEDEGS